MTEIRFYHLQSSSLPQALPAILGKAVEQGRRVVVRVLDSTAAARLDEHLWTYHPDSFLPHGMTGDAYAGDQPIWLTEGDDNPNRAEILIVTDGRMADDAGDFTLCCDMIDGRNEDEVSAARKRWAAYKEKGFTITYWQQGETGGWVQKA